MIGSLDRVVFGEVARARPYLLVRAVLLLLGLDCVVELLPHGGRYGVGGFNVAHFAILDRLLPIPTPSLYLGALFAVSGLSFVSVVAGPRRPILALIALLYTAAWASSLLDAYQHHYLTSLLLVSMTAMVGDEADGAFVDSVGPSPGYRSFIVTCALMYLFAAIAKLEPGFLSGEALARIAPPESIESIAFPLARLGLDTDETYAWLARAAIGVELASACALLLALRADRDGTQAPLAIASLGVIPLSFHLVAGSLGLGIGWFGELMMTIVVIAFAPRPWVDRAAAALRSLGDRAIGIVNRDRFSRTVIGALLLVLGAAGLASLDLPGVALGSVVVLATAIVGAIARRDVAFSKRLPLALGVAAIAIACAVSHPRLGVATSDGFVGLPASTVRYDYYRFVAGDAYRRGEFELATIAYRRAARYAPDDDARVRTEAKIRRLTSEPDRSIEARER